MLWTLLAWAAFIAMLWYGWSAIALIRAALNNGFQMLWIVALWQAASAVAALVIWRAALVEVLSVGAIIGLLIAASNPFLWALGNVANRLRSHGLRMGRMLRFQ